MNKNALSLILSGFMFLWGNVVHAATFTVDTTDDTIDAFPGDGVAVDANGNCSLRAAIMEANATGGMHTIILPEGVFILTVEGAKEDACMSGDLDIMSDLVIQGAGWNSTVIDGNQIDRVFHIFRIQQVTIEDVTIRNGRAPDGDPLLNGENPGNGEDGGGILNRSGLLTINRCFITGNRAGDGRGNSEYMVSGRGGHGGGLYNAEGTVILSDSRIGMNASGNGGIYTSPCSGGGGGGIYHDGGTMTLFNCVVDGNETGYSGTHYTCMREYGSSGSGGGICSNGTLKLVNCEISGNRTVESGIEGGSGCGGGIRNYGQAQISYSLISGNSTAGGSQQEEAGDGGGIYNEGNLEITHSTIESNSTGFGVAYWSRGGGICSSKGEVILKNSTISHNFTSYGFGEGISNLEYSQTIINNCTVCYNYDDCYNHDEIGTGIGIVNFPLSSYSEYNPILKIKNTIVANNGSGGDCYGDIVSEGYNLIKDTSQCDITGDLTGNITQMDPLLGPLKDNTGPTPTHALLNGSPAIDAGDPVDFEPTDQRGVPRPLDGDGDMYARSDIGAFEAGGFNDPPSVQITYPPDGVSINGIVNIEVTASDDIEIDRLELYIDGELKHTEEPSSNPPNRSKRIAFKKASFFKTRVNRKKIYFSYPNRSNEVISFTVTYEWDTATCEHGDHTVSAVVYDSSGQKATAQVDIIVADTLTLQASRHTERAWIIRRQYGKIEIAVDNPDAMPIAKYIIYRKADDGAYQAIKEISTSEFPAETYVFIDKFLENDKSYAYKAIAVNNEGIIVAISCESSI